MAAPVVLLLVFVLGALLAGHAVFGGSTARSVRRLAAGERARRLADAAATEAWFRLGQRVNDPSRGGSLWTAVRCQPGGFDADMALDDLPGLTAELGEDAGLSLADGRVRVHVEPQTGASAVVPCAYDRQGRVTVEAAVRDEGEGVTRRIRRTYDLAVSLASTPRPFDVATVFLADADELVNVRTVGRSANALIENAAVQLADLRASAQAMRAAYEQMVAELQTAEGQADDQIASLRQAEALLDDFLARAPLEVAVQDGPLAAEARAVRRFPPSPFALVTRASGVELSDLDLPSRVESRTRAIDEESERQLGARRALQAFLESKPRDAGPLVGLTAAWIAAATPLAFTYEGLLLDDYAAFQRLVTYVAGADYQAVFPHIFALQAGDFYRRSSMTVAQGDPWSLADGRSIGTKVSQLLDDEGIRCGMVYVDNPTEELVLDRTMAGRIVLVVAGDVTIRRLDLDSAADDLCTVICFGRLRVEGTAATSLVAAGSFSSASSSSITGNLTWVRPEFSKVPSTEVFRGSLTRDFRYQAGPKGADGTMATVEPGHQVVCLGPYPAAETVAWE